jgi:anthranilate synthase component 1
MLIRCLDDSTSLPVLQRLAPRRYPVLLESAARGSVQARYDLLLGFPQGGLRLDRDGVTRRLDGEVMPGGFLDALDAEFMATRGRGEARSALPFLGGWALFLGYELGAQIEPRLRLKDDDLGLPRALALRCPVALLRDHRDGSLVAIAEAGHEAALEQLAQDVASVVADRGPGRIAMAPPREDEPAQFLDGVHRILDYIAAGDVFQVNLSRGWEARFEPGTDLLDLYAALRQPIRRRSRAAAVGRLGGGEFVAGATGVGAGRRAADAPDRRHATALSRRRRCARVRRTRRASQGTRRTHHADRPGTQ